MKVDIDFWIMVRKGLREQIKCDIKNMSRFHEYYKEELRDINVKIYKLEQSSFPLLPPYGD